MELMMSLFGMKLRRALVIAPHADDEILGAGGLIARCAAEGWEVHLLFATISGYTSMARQDVSSTDARVSEVESAMKTLAVSGYDVLFRETNHCRLDVVPQAALISFVEQNLHREVSLVVVPSRAHCHQDHRAMADACTAALRPAPRGHLPFVPVVLGYGSPVGDWGFRSGEFRATVFVDISQYIETKLKALDCYTSQVCEHPHPRSLQSQRSWSAYWGGFAGVSYAEPFECLRFAVH
jgi:N-acetylglucosamine malate deacetylase 1